eukprot:5259246-Amphidinium_carterae.1
MAKALPGLRMQASSQWTELHSLPGHAKRCPRVAQPWRDCPKVMKLAVPWLNPPLQETLALGSSIGLSASDMWSGDAISLLVNKKPCACVGPIGLFTSYSKTFHRA